MQHGISDPAEPALPESALAAPSVERPLSDDPDGPRAPNTGAGDGAGDGDELDFGYLAASEGDDTVMRDSALLRLALDAGRCGTWDWDMETGRVAWSDRIHRFHGLAPGSFSGRVEDFSALIHPDDRPRLWAAINRAIADDRPYAIEFRTILPDGRERWLSTAGRVLRGPDGRPQRMLGATQDIDERHRILAEERRAREALQRSLHFTERLQAITSALSRALTEAEVADAVLRGGVGALSGAHGVLLGIRPGGDALELLGLTGYPDEIRESLQGSIPLSVDWPLQTCLQARTPFFLESPAEFAARWPVAAAFIATLGDRAALVLPLLFDGRPLGVLGIGFTAERHFPDDERAFVATLGEQASQALERARLFGAERAARAEAEAALRAREEFLAVASHELRTPLAALQLQIDGAGRLLRRSDASGEFSDPDAASGAASDGPLAAQIAARLARIRVHGERLQRLIDTLLEVSEIQARGLALRRSEVDLVALVQAAVARAALEATRAGSTLDLRVDAAIGSAIGAHPGAASEHAPRTLLGRWDAGRLAQLVDNLLANAIKYGAQHPIELWLMRTDQAAQLQVRDQGIGIASESHARIFERFGRAVSERHYGGLGLGLWLVREIAHAHGGTVTVTSAPGEGACFTVSLPLDAGGA